MVGEKKVNLKKLLSHLARKKIKTLLVEGGGTINWEFIKQDFFDEIIITIVPILIGGKKATTLVNGNGFSLVVQSPKLKLKKIKSQRNEIVLHYSKI